MENKKYLWAWISQKNATKNQLYRQIHFMDSEEPPIHTLAPSVFAIKAIVSPAHPNPVTTNTPGGAAC